MDNATPRDHHDEPFVIDNGPLGIDVGPKHEDKITEHVDGWLRKDSLLNRILAIRKVRDGSDGEVEIETTDLNKSRPVVIALKDGWDRKLELLWMGDDVKIRTTEFKLTQRGRRLRQSDGLKILNVSWHDSGNKFHSIGDGTHDKIFVALLP